MCYFSPYKFRAINVYACIGTHCRCVGDYNVSLKLIDVVTVFITISKNTREKLFHIIWMILYFIFSCAKEIMNDK